MHAFFCTIFNVAINLSIGSNLLCLIILLLRCALFHDEWLDTGLGGLINLGEGGRGNGVLYAATWLEGL